MPNWANKERGDKRGTRSDLCAEKGRIKREKCPKDKTEATQKLLIRGRYHRKKQEQNAFRRNQLTEDRPNLFVCKHTHTTQTDMPGTHSQFV